MSEFPEIGVSMTTRMSLEHWDRLGFLDRELGIYGKIADALGARIVFISYGGAKEIEYLGGDARFGVVPKALPALGDLTYSVMAGRALKPVWDRLWLLKSNQMRGAWVALRPQRKKKLPFLLRCGMEWLEGLELANDGSKLYRAAVASVENHLYHRADAVMLPNPTSVEFVKNRFKINPDKIHLFMNSIDCETFQPNESLMRIPKRIVFVGRVFPTKRIDLLIRATANIPGADLVVVGKEPDGLDPSQPSYKEELQKLAQELSVKVHFYGSVPNQALPEILNQASVFVLPSMLEGSPKALMEAMASGCPCIGTRAPGILEIMEHEKNGLLIDATEEELTQSITRLLEDQDLATRLGQQAVHYARKHFDLRTNITREAELIRSLMRDPRAA